MTLTTLLTTFNKSDSELLSLVLNNHLEGDVLIGNQCGKLGQKTLPQAGLPSIAVYALDSSGVSNNRNELLSHADADIITFADDDLIFTPGYVPKVLSFFEGHPEAQMVRYNVQSQNPERPIFQISEAKRVGFRDISKYGVWGFFFRRQYLLDKDLSFNPKLGPGAQLSHGEDTVFLKAFIDTGAVAYQDPFLIATTPMDQSSWYGQNIENDILADGYCYQIIRGGWAGAFGLNRYFRHRNYYPGYSLLKFMRIFKKGRQMAKSEGSR